MLHNHFYDHVIFTRDILAPLAYHIPSFLLGAPHAQPASPLHHRSQSSASNQLHDPHLTHVSYIRSSFSSLLNLLSTPPQLFETDLSSSDTGSHALLTLATTTHLTPIPKTPARGHQRIPLMSIEVCSLYFPSRCRYTQAWGGWRLALALYLCSLTSLCCRGHTTD